MDLNSVGKLLTTICVHYPSFQKHVAPEGSIIRDYAEEWLRVIGFLDYEEALDLLDDYLALPDGNRYAPDVKWFLKNKGAKKDKAYFSPGRRIDRLDEHGTLMDAEGRLYAFPDRPDEVYHYDSNGRIVDRFGHEMR